MKAFGCLIPGKKAGWMEKPIPKPGPFDALVRPIAISPCTSDVHNAFNIGNPPFMEGRVLGHEAVAEIVELGSELKEYKVGDKIVVASVTPDWRKPSIQDTFHQHTEKLCDSFRYAFSLDGVFAEYFIVPDVEMNAARLPEGMPLNKALMACDMMTTGFNGAEQAEIVLGETVVVLGAGPVGLMAVAGATMRGAGRLLVVESRENRIALAKEYGATDVVDFTTSDVVKQIKECTGKAGVDKVIICGGDKDALGTAIRIVRPGGIVSNINMYTGTPSLEIPLLAWGSGLSQKTIRGGLCPGGRRRVEKMLALIQFGRIDPSKLISHSFQGLEYVETGFNLMVEKPADLIKPAVFL